MIRFGVAKRSFPGNPWCGDAAFTHEDDARVIMAVMDGLGHSQKAAHAAQLAVARLGECMALPLQDMLRSVEDALRDTVGGALGIAVIHKERAILETCGVGNIGLQLSTRARLFRFSGEPGIMGEREGRFRPVSFSYQAGDVVVMYSDGIRSAYSARDLVHILYPDPGRISKRILDEYARPDDDALVLVGCETG